MTRPIKTPINDVTAAPVAAKCLHNKYFTDPGGTRYQLKLEEADTSRLSMGKNGAQFTPEAPQSFEMRVYEVGNDGCRGLSGQFVIDPGDAWKREIARHYQVDPGLLHVELDTRSQRKDAVLMEWLKERFADDDQVMLVDEDNPVPKGSLNNFNEKLPDGRDVAIRWRSPSIRWEVEGAYVVSVPPLAEKQARIPQKKRRPK